VIPKQWDDESQYSYLGNNTSPEQWAWEFLRRNKEYQTCWKTLEHRYEIIQLSLQIKRDAGIMPCDLPIRKPDELWKGYERTLEGAIYKNLFENSTASESNFIDIPVVGLGDEDFVRGKIPFPLETAMAIRDVLGFLYTKSLVNPKIDQPEYLEFNFFLGYGQDFKDPRPVYQPQPFYDPGKLPVSHPCWVFNLDQPISTQLEYANKWLQKQQSKFVREGRLKLRKAAGEPKKIETMKNYLRIIDANSGSPSPSVRTIGEVLKGKYEPNVDEWVKRSWKEARDWLKGDFIYPLLRKYKYSPPPS
jgi:hypothetical protein